MSRRTRRIARTILAAAIVTLGLTGMSAVAAHASPVSYKMNTCISSVFNIHDYAETGWMQWQQPIISINTFDFVNNGGATEFCALEGGSANLQYEDINTGSCLTYGGSRTGGANSTLYELGCARGNTKASQQWTLWTNHKLTNAYSGPTYCTQNQGLDYHIATYLCNGEKAQQWALIVI